MRLLELFSGTKSVSKVAETFGFDVISLDLKKADINCDILDWDYTIYQSGYFDVVWASPPCTEYSIAKSTGIRNIEYANKIVLRTIDIIKYFNPKYYIIENPQTGLLKKHVLWMKCLMLILITVSMVCLIVKELDYGIMFFNGYQNLYV